VARDSALEAIKLAPTLVPAAVLAAKYMSEAHQLRRALKIIEAAWIAHPHPDLAEAYAHIKPGDPPQLRLSRIENLVEKNSGHLESGLALARAAIDAGDFKRARTALAPFVDTPTQRVAMLMAEIEHGERGDNGRARAWTVRAVRALHDPVWTADGYVSDRWRPVSPVTGRLDAFQWQVPVAALPSNKAIVVDDGLDDSLISPPSDETSAADEAVTITVEPDAAAAQPVSTPNGTAAPAEPAAAVAEPAIPLPPPIFHRRQSPASAGPPPVIPIVRAPDDPGIDEESGGRDFSDRTTPPPSQPSGWRGYRMRREN
jgi:HemY protein